MIVACNTSPLIALAKIEHLTRDTAPAVSRILRRSSAARFGAGAPADG
jgi:hypothetical protein